MRIEYETSLNYANMHIFIEQPYEEDYQIQMLRQNEIQGILSVEGCEIEGKSRYTYEISGCTSMQKLYEKNGIKKEELKEFIMVLLDTMERIQRYMLEPNNLILQPECIFRKNGEWYFCYLPRETSKMKDAFHQLSEYFVRSVDYKDTDSILLAYELHKASFQEHYSLRQVIEEYEKNEARREQELEKPSIVYAPAPAPSAIRENPNIWHYQGEKERDKYITKYTTKYKDKNRWGLWEDFIAESTDQSGN